MVRRAYGFHTADAVLALVMTVTGPIKLQLGLNEHTFLRPDPYQDLESHKFFDFDAEKGLTWSC